MDPSALIFVALAVAWAVYLIPKALEHHEESARSRTVDAFSHSVRVLARREPVSRREAALVAGDGPAPPSQRRLAAAARLPVDPRIRRQAAARAARRRLRVLTLVLAENAVVAVLAAAGIFGWVWMAVPAGILVAWLVACRLMVRRERAELPVVRRTGTSDPGAQLPEQDADATAGIPVVAESVPPRDPDAWDPVPVTLPTYVSKPVATRSVRTIDLDSTGVWTSGRSEADSALVRESGEAAQTRAEDEGDQRALGS